MAFTTFVPVGRGGPSTGGGSTVVPVGIPKPSTGGVTTVDPVGRAFLIYPPEGKKELTGTILDAVSRMLNTYADLSGDATYVNWKIFPQKFTGD